MPSGAAKDYQVDPQGFLKKFDHWDEGFAEAMAPQAGIEGGLEEDHWRVIRFIRGEFEDTGECPLVFRTCRASGLSPRELKSLFPAGYTKGACRLAGITFRDRFMDYYGENLFRRVPEAPPEPAPAIADKEYRVDTFGFLVDPSEWDEEYAENKAREMKVPGGLSERHQEILLAIRRFFSETGTVPSVSEACEALSMEMDEMERLFPDGYVRGAVKIAGLSMK
jgi:tRNA 2-thiouridine synthesizing protein E